MTSATSPNLSISYSGSPRIPTDRMGASQVVSMQGTGDAGRVGHTPHLLSIVIAGQPMSAEVRQPKPPGHSARVAAACGKSQGRIPLFSQMRDGVRDLFVDFEYVTSAVNECSEPVGIGVPGLRPEPRAEMQGRT